MDATPKTAFTSSPRGLVSGGSAWNARWTSACPSSTSSTSLIAGQPCAQRFPVARQHLPEERGVEVLGCHDVGIFPVVTVVALAEPRLLERVLTVERLGDVVRHAHLQRHTEGLQLDR